jgi:L-threonylcarbamoyladenylate synthase
MSDILQETLTTLRSGGIIVYPTDTVWGIGCDGRNPEAVAKIFALKQRVDSKSMITLLHDPAQLNRYARVIPDVAWDIVETAASPITLIYEQGYNLAKNLMAEDGTIALRVVSDDYWVYKLLRKFQAPIVSTSANISGQPAPKGFSDIDPAILDGVDYVVDLPSEPSASKPSTILKIEVNGEFTFIRK